MLFFVVAIAFLAAANAAHVTTAKDVNGLIDKTVAEIQKHKKVVVPGLNNADITGLEHLKREGDCVQTAVAGTWQCKAIALEATFNAEGESAPVTIRITFAVVVDTEGRLVHFTLENVDLIDPEDPVFYFSFKKLVKNVGNAIKKGAEAVVVGVKAAVASLAKQKVETIVTTVAGSIVGDPTA